MSRVLYDTTQMNISTLGSPSPPISAKAIAAELEMAVLKKLKSNAEQHGTALVQLINDLLPLLLHPARCNSTSTPNL
jgi:hypothetical protein